MLTSSMSRIIDIMHSYYEHNNTLLQGSSMPAASLGDHAGEIISDLIIANNKSLEYIEINNVREINFPAFLSVSRDSSNTTISKCFSILVNLRGPSWTRINMPSTLQVCYVKPGDTIRRTVTLGKKTMVTPLVPENSESKLVLYTINFDPNVQDGKQIPEHFQVIKKENEIFGLTLNHVAFLKLKLIAFTVCGLLNYELVELLVALRICCGRQKRGRDYDSFQFLNVCISDIDTEKKVCVWRILYEKNELKDRKTYIHHEHIKCDDHQSHLTTYSIINTEIEQMLEKMKSNVSTYSAVEGDPIGDIILDLIESRSQWMEYIGIHRITDMKIPDFLSRIANIDSETFVSKCFSLYLYLKDDALRNITMHSYLDMCYVKPGNNDESKILLYTAGFRPSEKDAEVIRDNFQEIKNENIMFGLKWRSWDFLRMKMTAYVVCGLLYYEIVELLVALRVSSVREPYGYEYRDFKIMNVIIYDIDSSPGKKECVWSILYEKKNEPRIEYIHRELIKCSDPRRLSTIQGMLDKMKDNKLTPVQFEMDQKEARRLKNIQNERRAIEREHHKREDDDAWFNNPRNQNGRFYIEHTHGLPIDTGRAFGEP
jgi:hypothetical protein